MKFYERKIPVKNIFKENGFLALLAFFSFLLICIPVFSRDAFAQQAGTLLKGQVLELGTKKGIPFVSVVYLEEKQKVYTDKDGNFQIKVNRSQPFSIIIRAPGFKLYRHTFYKLPGQDLKIVLNYLSVRGGALEVKADREHQKVSRLVISKEEIDLTAGSFGDSLGVLNALPGINRSSGITGSRGGPFGNLVIRGARHYSNRYYIDDVPLIFPQHAGFMHATIANEMIGKMVVYSSSSPAEYGEITGAIIEYKTIDKISEFQGNVGMSFISFNSFVGGPIHIHQAQGDGDNSEQDAGASNYGHWAAAARVGYWNLLLPKITDSPYNYPEYFDYQLKGEVFLSSKGKHSIGVLFFGNQDRYDMRNENSDEYEDKEISEEGADPNFAGIDVNLKYMSHSQSIFLNSRFNDRLSHRLVFYHAYAENIIENDIPLVPTLETHVTANPSIIGLKDKLRWEILPDIMEVRTGLDLNYYILRGNGSYPELADPTDSFKNIDYGDESLFKQTEFDLTAKNTVIGYYLEDKVTVWNFTLLPGIRIDHLDRINKTVYDPRGLISYEFPWEMILSVAGGLYHSFPQTNALLFLDNSDRQSVPFNTELKPEESIQRSVAVEQNFKGSVASYVIRVEGFMNDFDKLVENDPALSGVEEFSYRSTGEAKTRGFEVMVKKDLKKGSGFYGTLSYTYTDAKYRSNLSQDPEGDKFIRAEWELRHALKLSSGFRFFWLDLQHDITLRFDLLSGSPYTPIVGSVDTGDGRYYPIYGDLNGKEFDLLHRLDLRYTNTNKTSWGQVRWYIEIINVYGYKPKDQQKWRYDQAYSSSNPELISNPNNFDLIPIFGVEVVF